MKRITVLLILAVWILAAAGCGSEETESGFASVKTAADEASGSQAEASDSGMEASAGTTKEAENQVLEDVDYDLTTMSSEMVYAIVYQMMAEPDSYVGKTICMDGLYYASYDEETEQNYFFCIIQDATACCAQGLEFVWGDGSHVYPDEYPEDYAEVVVQGIFETYKEDGYLYCRLKDAALEVKGE